VSQLLYSGCKVVETHLTRLQRIIQSLQTTIYAGDLSRYDLQLLPVISGNAIHFLIDQTGKLLQVLFGQDVFLYLVYYQPFKFAAVEKSESFHKGENQLGYGLVGYFRGRPVFNLHYQGEPYIILIDLNKFCTWRQYKPLQILDREEYISQELTFLLKMFTKESAKESIQSNPKLLLDKDGNQRSEDDVISELQLQVHFRLLEQYEIAIKDNDSGYKVRARW